MLQRLRTRVMGGLIGVLVVATLLHVTRDLAQAAAQPSIARPTDQPPNGDNSPSLQNNESAANDNPGGDDDPPFHPKASGGHVSPSDRGNPSIQGGRPLMDGNLSDFKALVNFINENHVLACAVNQLDNFNNGPLAGPDGFQDEPLQDDASPQLRFMHSPINVGNFIFIYFPDSDGIISPPSADDSWLGVGVNIANGDGDVCRDNPATPENECGAVTKLTTPPDLPTNIMVPFDADGNGNPCVLGTGMNSRWFPLNPVLTFDESIEGITLAFKLCATDPQSLSSPEFQAQYLQRHAEATMLSLFGLQPENFDLFPPVGSTCDDIRLRGLDNNLTFPDGLGNDDIEIVINRIDSQVSALFPGEDYISVTRYRLAQLGMTLRSDSTGDLSNEDSMYTICDLQIPEIESSKQVRCVGDGDDDWRESAVVAPGTVVEFKVEVSNAGNIPLSVTLNDTVEALTAANLTVDTTSLHATLHRPSNSPGVMVDPSNAAMFGLNPVFFSSAPAGFLGGVIAGGDRFLGTLNPTAVCNDPDPVVLGDRVVLTFRATAGATPALCNQAATALDLRNSLKATGDPDIPPNLNGNEVIDMAGGAPDTPRERLRGGDDNVVTIDVLCRDVALTKEVRVLPNGSFVTGDTPLIIPASGGSIQLQYRFTAQNDGDASEDVTVSDVALCQHVMGIPGITVSSCPLCEQPTPGELSQTVAPDGTFQTSCNVTFADLPTLRTFLTLDNGQTCESSPGAGAPNDCYRNCATLTSETSDMGGICASPVATASSSATICNRVCGISVTKRVRCILNSCSSPTQFGPFVDATTDPLSVSPGSCVQYELEVHNDSTTTSMCRIRLQDVLSGQPNDIGFVAGSAQLDVGGVACPMPACFNTAGNPCEINPASCPAFAGGVFAPGQTFKVHFSATIPTTSNANPPDPTNMITVDGAADCPGGTPAYSCNDSDTVELDVRSASLRCDSKQWAYQSDVDADCDPDAPFSAFASSIDLRTKVFPVLLNLRVQATNTGQVPLNVTAQDTALTNCVNTVAGVDFVNSPACELGTSKLVQPGAQSEWLCQIRIDAAAAARAMDTCDGALDGEYNNTASVSGVTTAAGTNLCTQGTVIQGAPTCSAEVLLPPPCNMSVNKQVKCKTDPDTSYATSVDALPGTALTYRVRVTNNGTTNIPKVCLTDMLSCDDWLTPNSVAANIQGTDVNSCVASTFAASLVSGARACYSFGTCRPAAPWLAPNETLTITLDVQVPSNFSMVGLETDCFNSVTAEAFSENCAATPRATGACSQGASAAEFNVLLPSLECESAFCVDTDNNGTCDGNPVTDLTLPDTTMFPLTIEFRSSIFNTGESAVSNARICDPNLVANAITAGLVFISCDYCDGACDGDPGDQCADVAPLAPGAMATAVCRVQVPTRESWDLFAGTDPDGNITCYRDGISGQASVGAAAGLCTSGSNTALSSTPCQTTLCIPVPLPMGGCCLENGQCLYITEEDCNGQGGMYHGDNVQCLGDSDHNGIDDLCEQPVPTVSEWGLVIMALLLLVAAKIHFGKPVRTAR